MEALAHQKLSLAIEKRQSQLGSWIHDKNSTYRMVHRECAHWRLDKVGPVVVAGWWSDRPPSDKKVEELNRWLLDQGFSRWYLRWRPGKKGVSCPPKLFESSIGVPETWNFGENGLLYEARKDQGDAFGLFLDQRNNRKWVREHSKGKSVLNLFAYTCGFSLAAAAGGAESVFSVDLSKKYLQWGQRNFELNDLNPKEYRFFDWDSLQFLIWASKKGLQFDTIVCDPPSFSRNGKKIFRIEKSYSSLIRGCLAILKPGGRLFFSTNFERWNKDEWKARLKKEFEGPVQFPRSQPDFRESEEIEILKSVIFDKKN